MKMSQHKLTQWRYVSKLLMALSEFYLLQTVLAVRESPCFGLVIDLSSDGVSHENMLVYVTYFDQLSMSSELRFLCCLRLLGKDGESIFRAVERICQILGLDMIHKLRTFCADGDGAMPGHRVGLVGRLRRCCDCVVAMHCAAHKQVLAVSHIAEKFDSLELLDKVIKTVHALFLRRTKHFGHWETFAKRHGVTAFKFPLFVATRWYSPEYCIKQLLDNYFALVRFLQGATTPGCRIYWQSAVPVLALLTEVRTVVVLNALADILAPLERSRKLFETSGYKLSELTAELNASFEALEGLSAAESLQSSPGCRMRTLMEHSSHLYVDGGYITLHSENHSWSISLGTTNFSEADLHSEVTNIVIGIREQMSSRFPDGERGFAHLFSTCFEFSRFASLKAQHLERYGDAEIGQLVDILSAKQASDRKFWCQVPMIHSAHQEEVDSLTCILAGCLHCHA